MSGRSLSEGSVSSVASNGNGRAPPSPAPSSSLGSSLPGTPSVPRTPSMPGDSPSPMLNGLNGVAAGGGPEAEQRMIAALRQQVAELQSRLRLSEAKVAMWEECMQQFMHSMMLSPDMNDMYKEMTTDILRDALGSVEQISAVRFVDCSFPSVPSEAPHIQLERWESMNDSEWTVRWAPSWSVQVAVEGSQYLSFNLTLRLFDFRMAGRMKFRASHDLSSIVMSFLSPPKLRLKSECSVRARARAARASSARAPCARARSPRRCTPLRRARVHTARAAVQVSWGSVPLPLQTYIESVVQDEMVRWVNDNAVAPNVMEMHPSSFQPKTGLTDQDVEKALRAVELAREVSAMTDGS